MSFLMNIVSSTFFFATVFQYIFLIGLEAFCLSENDAWLTCVFGKCGRLAFSSCGGGGGGGGGPLVVVTTTGGGGGGGGGNDCSTSFSGNRICSLTCFT